MASEPWFKFYAADYVLDDEVDSLPLEAQAILIRMWAICHTGGSCSCPAEPQEIARKARLSLEPVVRHYEQLVHFFELRDGRLYSRRMEEERQKSEVARTKANRRWRPSNADGIANCNADSNAQSQSQSQSQKADSPPPLKEKDFDSSLQKRESKSKFSQSDFDARDLRKLSDALKKIALNSSAGIGSGVHMTLEQEFEWACDMAGISVQRGLEVQERGKRWPETQAFGASA